MALRTITEVQDDLPERLRAAAAAARAFDEEMTVQQELLHEQRDSLIVAAVEAGHSQRTVARWAGLSIGRTCAILALPRYQR